MEVWRRDLHTDWVHRPSMVFVGERVVDWGNYIWGILGAAAQSLAVVTLKVVRHNLEFRLSVPRHLRMPGVRLPYIAVAKLVSSQLYMTC